MLSRQRGVAVVTALLLATLAITIVASLFWQQQVQVRSIENQRFQLQKKWVLRGALDWARLILREDARTSNEVDHLGEPWAVTLGETQLDQYVDNGKSDTEASEASLSGKIADAQAKFNLNNLALNGVIVPHQVEIFQRLLSNLNLDPGLAKTAATTIADTQNKAVLQNGGKGNNANANGNTNTGSANNSTNSAGAVGGTGAAGGEANNSLTAPLQPQDSLTPRVDTTPNVKFLRFSQIDDLLAVSGFAPETIDRLKEFVTVLPGKTRLNVNTTSAEVLAAYLDGASLSDAALIITIRDRAYFRDLTDFKSRVTLKNPDFQDTDVSFSTNFFIINGKVKLSRSTLEINALLERTGVATKVLWVKEV
ncbi:MAG: type II secretion system minor pseudopilin GspK [Burkholderiaceae bacterium]|nr:type II secretion system minor pseudopilin GspK [Burkholderiaceae bacterium]